MQQTSPANEHLLYYSRIKRKEEAKARIPALLYIQLLSLAVNTLPKRKKLKLEFAANERLLEQSERKKPKLES